MKADAVQKILQTPGVHPTVDAFSEVGTRRMTRWWVPGSPECQDAFEADWSRDVLWLNPPFTKYAEVVKKIIADRAHAVMIIPE